MNGWGWKPDRTKEDGCIGSPWLRAFAIVVPFVTVGLLLLMLHFVGGTLTTAEGVLFDLPEADVGDGAVTESVALIIPMRNETLVFFDDARFVLGNASSVESLGNRLTERFSRSADKTLLTLADRRVSCGDLMAFAAVARKSGVGKVLFAEKRAQEAAE